MLALARAVLVFCPMDPYTECSLDWFFRANKLAGVEERHWLLLSLNKYPSLD